MTVALHAHKQKHAVETSRGIGLLQLA